jgi:transcriptional regulator with XRE-family HTH domain
MFVKIACICSLAYNRDRERRLVTLNLGENIKQFRKVRNLTQSELSKETGIPRSTIQKYESGSIQHVSLNAVETISSALDVQPNDLVGWHSNDPQVEELIAIYQRLNETDRLIVLQLLGRLTRND